ncbi:MAG: hypothetical protein M0Q95_20390 [Porticoccaceae bacterium]|nr:hypothetical protein [Porticoccaceae bacterium]
MPAQQPQLANPDHYLISASGRLGSPPRSPVSKVDRILEHAIQQNPANGLVIHFHGGLVSRDDALQHIVPPLTTRYTQAGAYPLFFIWESGLAQTFWNNKQQILRDPAFRELVKKVSEWVARRTLPAGGAIMFGAGQQGIGDAASFRLQFDQWFEGRRETPPVEEYIDPAEIQEARVLFDEDQLNLEALAREIEAGLEDDPAFRTAIEDVFNSVVSQQDGPTLMGGEDAGRAPTVNLSDAALVEMFLQGPGAGAAYQPMRLGPVSWLRVAYFVGRIVFAVIARFRNGRHHGPYCTIVEEVLRHAFMADLIGATIWNAMKNDTAESFQPDSDTCGWLVLQKLKALEDAGRRFTKITLVGHPPQSQ